MTTLRRDHARIAYDALAPGYDLLTRDHDHVHWTWLLESRAQAFGLTGKRLLDVACGTGNTLVPMLMRGYEATGVDVSEAMLAEAERKTAGRATLAVADMRELPMLGEFDLVWCLGDALNYLDTRSELVSTLNGFHANLAPGGVIVFDVNTLATFRRLYSSLLAMPTPNRIIVVDGQGSDAVDSGGAATAQIDRMERGESGWWHRVRTEHHHRHHPEESVRAAIDEVGLLCAAVFGARLSGVLDASLDDLEHSKAVYIARHGAP